MVNRPERLVDMCELSRKYGLEPKILRMVYSKVNTAPVLILMKMTKNANKYLKILKPIYIYEEDRNIYWRTFKYLRKNEID